MKKLLTIFFSLFALQCAAQTQYSDVVGTPGTYTITDGRIKILYNFYIPKSTAYSFFNGQQIAGALMFNSTLNRVGASQSNGMFRSLAYFDELSAFLTAETDPIFGASIAKGITATNVSNWNSAFSWGNHAGLYKPVSYVPTWSEITGKPTIPAAQIQTDYSQASSSALDFIKNKPDLSVYLTSAYTGFDSRYYAKSLVDAMLALKEPVVAASTTDKYYRGDKTFQSLNTTAVAEGVNLYYTQNRFNSSFAAKTTTDLAEGTNKYYTDARVQAIGDARYIKSASFVMTSGSAVGPTILIAGSTASVNVTFNNAFADNNYQASATCTSGLSLLGSVTIQGITTKTSTGCTVAIKNTGLLSINLSTLVIDVVAIKVQ